MKKILLFAIIISLLIPMLTVADKEYKEEEVLLSLLKNIGGEFLEGDISVNGVLIKDFLDREELNVLAEEIKTVIGLENEIKEETYEEYYNQISFYDYDKNNNPITLILSSIRDENGKIKETFFYINIINNEHFSENNDIIYRVKKIFNDYESTMEITTSMVGISEGNLLDGKLEDKALKAFKKLKGEFVEEFKDLYLLSYTAYTPYIESFIGIDKKKINLNLAIRYNDYEDRTYIWIGTPIITSGY